MEAVTRPKYAYNRTGLEVDVAAQEGQAVTMSQLVDRFLLKLY
jgi:hypothetical protein